MRAFTSGRAPEESALESITTVAAQLEGYLQFFAELTDDQLDYVAEMFGDELQRSAESVADAALIIRDSGGNEVIAQALSRLPAFAIASVETGEINVAVSAPPGYIGSLLLPREVAALADGISLSTNYVDLRSMSFEADPEQFEHIVSFDLLTFIAEGDSQSLSFTTLRFDSDGAASTHLELVVTQTPNMQEHSTKIGDASFFSEVNQSGIGSMVVFNKGDWVVMLHTTQSAESTPLVSLEGVEALARLVANRL
ncbi:MAG: hypothetical protein O2913_13760 [Chloroflexi bacterium]|nr:hypothetical protein [Chloroflexota bacterium]